jgi:hypothetical protein
MANQEQAPQGIEAPYGATGGTSTGENGSISEASRQSDTGAGGQATAVAPQPDLTVGSLHDVLAIVVGHFGPASSVVLSAEACISAQCSLLLAQAEGCVALVLEGPASSGKTTALNLLMGQPLRDGKLVWVSDSFTPAAFLSHAANRTAEELDKNDLLPHIRHKTFIVPDLAPTFSAREEDLTKNVGVLTRVLDGQGYESDSGTHGHRGPVGDYRFTLLPLPPRLAPPHGALWRGWATVS